MTDKNQQNDDSSENELGRILQRRQSLDEARARGEKVEPVQKSVRSRNVYVEFQEYTRKEIKDFEKKFKVYNVSGTGKITLGELKLMMEKLGAPQTHLGLKAMIQEVDEDGDGMISFCEFMMIFRKAAAGELKADSGLGILAKQFEINVDEVGVKGAKTFFEAKVAAIRKTSKFEDEIREEQEEKKKEAEEKHKRQQSFKERAALFGGKGV